MKNIVRLGVCALFALGTLASAQSTTGGCPPPGCGSGGGDGKVTKKSATYKGKLETKLVEEINVSIPAVVAMHLHETYWNVNLSDLKNKNCECYRAGDHDVKTGKDFVYDILRAMKNPKSKWSGDGQVIAGNAYSTKGVYDLVFAANEKHAKIRVDSYPGIVFKKGQVHWKGPIYCVNRKVVEKFTNSTDWKVDISLGKVTPGFPTLLVGDKVGNATAPAFVETLYTKGAKNSLSFTNAQAGFAKKTTEGWLDDHILEVLVFDGSETAGTKTAQVNFKLTGNF